MTCRLVAALDGTLRRVPVTCKIRCRDTPDETARYARALVDAGASFSTTQSPLNFRPPGTFFVALKQQSLHLHDLDDDALITNACRSMVAVHGRTRAARSRGAASWAAVAAVVAACPDVPVIVNGNVRTKHDADAAISATGAAAVMSAEALLANPSLFASCSDGEPPTARAAALEYLDVAAADIQADVPLPWARAHVAAVLRGARLLTERVADELYGTDTLPGCDSLDALRNLLTSDDKVPADVACGAPTRRDLQTDFDSRLDDLGRRDRHVFKSSCRKKRASAFKVEEEEEEEASVVAGVGKNNKCDDLQQLPKRQRVLGACEDPRPPLSDRARAAVETHSRRVCADCGRDPAKLTCVDALCRRCCRARRRAEQLAHAGERHSGSLLDTADCGRHGDKKQRPSSAGSRLFKKRRIVEQTQI